ILISIRRTGDGFHPGLFIRGCGRCRLRCGSFEKRLPEGVWAWYTLRRKIRIDRQVKKMGNATTLNLGW
ncbi:hypothetical protein, partial [[Clostridium] scindens]